MKKVCDNIWDIEKKYDLFNKKINGIYFWKLIRFTVFRKILEKSNVYNNNENNLSFFNKLKYLFNKIIWHQKHGAIKRKKKKDILIFESPRKKQVDGEYIDIYTNELIKKLENKNYELIEGDYRGQHYNKPSEVRSYNNYFSLIDFLKNRIIGIRINFNEKKLIRKIELELNKSFNIKIDNLEIIIKKSIIDFNYQYKYYNKLFKKREPKLVYLVCSYGQEALIAACNKNNIESIEIQHGTITKYHLGYSFPNNSDIPYFPDQINLFGEYWYESTPFPIDKSNIRISGYPYMQNRIDEFDNINKINNQVLFISQHTITKKIAQIAYEFALKNEDYRVVYKLHPAEYKNWDDNYPFLYKGSKLDNFIIVDSDEKDLYELFLESEYLVGVYSTAVYEGLVLNCKTVLIDLPGIEYMDYLIENDFVKLASDSKELFNIINEAKFTSIEKDYFFKNMN